MDSLDELDVVIRRKRGRVIALIPQLNVYGKGADVQAALADLEEKKKALLADLEEFGETLQTLQVDNNSTGAKRGKSAGAGGIGLFAVKAAIVGCAVAAVILVAGVFVTATLETSINEIVTNAKTLKVGGHAFWSRVEQTLDRLAAPETDLPADKKAKLLADIRAIGTKWRPFLVEIHSALDVEASRAVPANAAGAK